MTAAQHRVYSNLYKDSVALMAISAAVMDLAGIDAASVVMATEANRENLSHAGLADDISAGPNDLLVAVRGEDHACAEALSLADQLLAEQPAMATAGGEQVSTPTNIQLAVTRDSSVNLALVSVPGQYAAAEALKALGLGLNVMIFSDNVSVQDEVEVKRHADARGLLVMGPDCGTALVNGVPLGFANVVRRGRIGVVGASGTGIQEITCRIHQLGEGVSQALGTGGRDLSAEVGGISTLYALHALDEDENTEVIVLVSKPPAEVVATAVLNTARKLSTPVVVIFVGADSDGIGDEGLHVATTLAGAADTAANVVTNGAAVPTRSILDAETQARLHELTNGLAASQRHVRGVFSGGTFCYEAQLLCQAMGIYSSSNTPIRGNPKLADIWLSQGDTIIDMGDDDFTRGRPHPMIDPTLRNERLLAEAEDPATAVLLFDVVLGYGAALDPVSDLLKVLDRARSQSTRGGRPLLAVAHACGTDEDPQNRSDIIAQLQDADVLVADSNAQAAEMAAFLVSQLAQPGKK